MNDFFVPLYLNNDVVMGMFKIAIERFIDIENITNRQEIVINSSVPLCEITCGKILQGNASVQLLKGYTRRTIQEIENSTISTYIKLIDIIDSNKYLKRIKDMNSLYSVNDGDLVEIKCKMKINSKLRKIQHVIDILEIESALEECTIRKDSNKELDKKALLNWFKSTLQSVKESKCTKYITDPLFDSDIKGIIPIQNKYLLMDLDCNYQTNFTVIGKISCVQRESNSVKNPIKTESCFDFINDKLSQLVSAELLDSLNIDELIDEEISQYIEIIPLIIYV